MRHQYIIVMIAAIAITFTLGSGSPAHAAKAGGVNIPDTATIDGTSIPLNGAGVRTKFGFKVYAGGLYLPKKATSAKAAIEMDGPKRVLLHFIYKKVDRKKLVKGWRKGFEKNLSKSEHAVLATKIDKFCTMFSDTIKGETYHFDYIPGTGTRIYRNDQLKGTIEGEDFMRGLLLIWIGDKPAHKKLKRGMLAG